MFRCGGAVVVLNKKLLGKNPFCITDFKGKNLKLNLKFRFCSGQNITKKKLLKNNPVFYLFSRAGWQKKS